MTKKERATVERAVRLLMEDDPNFSLAVSLLCGLVGWTLPQHDASADVKLLDLSQLHTIPEGPFRVSADAPT